MSSNLVFFGNERLSTGYSPAGAPTLEALIAAGYHITAVVANYEAPTSRRSRELEIEAIAKRHKIPLLLPTKLAEVADDLRTYNAPLAVLVAYGKIIPQSIIDTFPKGILNLHPSLLPVYRGSTPIEQAILDGIQETGVSIMGLVKAMDAGPIYAQQSIRLNGSESKFELTKKLHMLGIELLLETLPVVLAGTATPNQQDEAKATYTKQISKEDGVIDWRKPAEHIEREVRAYAGWPKSRAKILDKDIIILSTQIAEHQANGALVQACGKGFLEILELIGPTGRRMSGADFIRGYSR